ncbi:MAG: DUF6491 family protein [Pseudomonadota bacterium]
MTNAELLRTMLALTVGLALAGLVPLEARSETAQTAAAMDLDTATNDDETSSPTTEPPVAIPDLSLEELLNDPEAAEPIAEARRCIPRQSDARLLVLDDETLLVEGRGKRRWLNRLRHRCPGLRPDMILVTESRGGMSGMCELDTVTGVTRGVGLQSARCALGKFEPIDVAHAEMIERAFEAQRVAKRDAVRERRSERRAKRRAERRERRERRRESRAADESA